jgi:hypothetical protein
MKIIREYALAYKPKRCLLKVKKVENKAIPVLKKY